MTLTGFEHTNKVLRKKARLENRANKAAKRSDTGEQQSRKSSMKVSNQIEDVDSDSETTDSQHQQESDIEQMPMNEDIELSDRNLDDQLDSQDGTLDTRFEKLGPGVPNEALNPKSYAFVPSTWTQRIRPAGQQTKRSEGVFSVMH
jgi:hypothetical protein